MVFVGLLGMLCDSLLEIEDGYCAGQGNPRQRRDNSDLYWACQAEETGSSAWSHPSPSVCIRSQMSPATEEWEFSDLKKVVRSGGLGSHTDVRLTSSLALPAQNQATSVPGRVCRPEQELRQMYAPCGSGPAKDSRIPLLTWMDAVRFFAGEPLKQEKFRILPLMPEPLPGRGLNVLIHISRPPPGPVNAVSFDAYAARSAGNRRRELPSPSQCLFCLQYQSLLVRECGKPINIEWMSNFAHPVPIPGRVSQFCDAMIVDWPAA
jgi:hypothetical protein